MVRAFRLLITVVLLLLLVNFFVVPLVEPTMIYYPDKKIRQTPLTARIPFEDVYLTAADGVKINGWFIDHKHANKVILYFHGNGGNLSHRVDIIRLLRALPADLFLIDYHGYGNSEGVPSEKNLYLDAEAAYRYLIEEKRYLPSQIIVMGSSLGGAVATHLAANKRVGGLILQRTFTSAPAMAGRMNFFYRWPIVWIRSKFNTLKEIVKVTDPVFIVHSKKDEMIPYQMSVRIFEKANQPKKLLLLEKGRHNTLITDPKYIRGIQQILRPKEEL